METETHAASDTGAPRRVGAVLADARATAGITLVDIARETRVPLRHLQAIENDAHDSLPALPYTTGFVKSFARAVGLDPEATAAQFRAETNKTAHVPAAPAMEPLDERRLPPRGLLTISIVGVVAIVGAVVAYSAGMFDHKLPAEPTVVAEAPKATTEPAPAPAPTPTPVEATPQVASSDAAASPVPPPVAATPAGQPAAAPVATVPMAGGAVSITAIEDAWFRVSGWDAAANRIVTIKTGVLAKGERFDVPPTPGLKLWTGRAGALRISVGGRVLPPLGGPVQTVKNVSLNPGDLIARAAAPAGVTQ